MKKILLYFTVILVFILLVSGCTQSRKNELIYRYVENGEAVPFDSLKSEILGHSGAELMIVYPDSDLVIIHYDRFKTHQEIIEEHLIQCGYKITLIEKNKIEKKVQ